MAPSLRKRNHEGKVDKAKVEKGNNSQEDPASTVTRSEGLNALEPEGAMRSSVQTSEQSPHILDCLAWKTTRKRSPLPVKKTSDNWSKAAASLLGSHDPDLVGNVDTVSKKLLSGETSDTSANVEAIVEGMEELGGEPTLLSLFPVPSQYIGEEKEELGGEPTVQNSNKRKRLNIDLNRVPDIDLNRLPHEIDVNWELDIDWNLEPRSSTWLSLEPPCSTWLSLWNNQN